MHILINDFIGGVLDRGIPLYTRNLIRGLREEGFEVSVVRAPGAFRMLPRNLFYMIAVLVEQTVLPVLGYLLHADLTLYPYNSLAIADLLTRRGRIVVHDLEQLNRPLSFSKIYYLLCYRAVKWRNAPILTISELTRQRLTESGLFGDGAITILPNTFYAFERFLRARKLAAADARSLLLCTGSTANKDIETVVTDYLPALLARGYRVSVLGLHKAGDAPKLAALQSFIDSGQLRICGRLSDRAVAREYRAHPIVWVHSLREGFGRCVVEGRLAGSRVICTDIPEFAGLRDSDVYLYDNAAAFLATLERVEQLERTAAPVAPYRTYAYRELLRNAISESFQAAGTARGVPQPQPGAVA